MKTVGELLKKDGYKHHGNTNNQEVPELVAPSTAPSSPPWTVAESVTHSEFDMLLDANRKFHPERTNQKNLSAFRSEESLLTALVKNQPQESVLPTHAVQSPDPVKAHLEIESNIPCHHNGYGNSECGREESVDFFNTNWTKPKTRRLTIAVASPNYDKHMPYTSNTSTPEQRRSSAYEPPKMGRVALAAMDWENYFKPKSPLLKRREQVNDSRMFRSMTNEKADCSFYEKRDNSVNGDIMYFHQSHAHDSSQSIQSQHKANEHRFSLLGLPKCNSTPVSPKWSRVENTQYKSPGSHSVSFGFDLLDSESPFPTYFKSTHPTDSRFDRNLTNSTSNSQPSFVRNSTDNLVSPLRTTVYDKQISNASLNDLSSTSTLTDDSTAKDDHHFAQYNSSTEQIDMVRSFTQNYQPQPAITFNNVQLRKNDTAKNNRRPLSMVVTKHRIEVPTSKTLSDGGWLSDNETGTNPETIADRTTNKPNRNDFQINECMKKNFDWARQFVSMDRTRMVQSGFSDTAIGLFHTNKSSRSGSADSSELSTHSGNYVGIINGRVVPDCTEFGRSASWLGHTPSDLNSDSQSSSHSSNLYTGRSELLPNDYLYNNGILSHGNSSDIKLDHRNKGQYKTKTEESVIKSTSVIKLNRTDTSNKIDTFKNHNTNRSGYSGNFPDMTTLSPAAQRYEEHVLASVAERQHYPNHGSKAKTPSKIRGNQTTVEPQVTVVKRPIIMKNHFFPDANIEPIHADDESELQEPDVMDPDLWKDKLNLITQWQHEVNNAMQAGETDISNLLMSPDYSLPSPVCKQPDIGMHLQSPYTSPLVPAMPQTINKETRKELLFLQNDGSHYPNSNSFFQPRPNLPHGMVQTNPIGHNHYAQQFLPYNPVSMTTENAMNLYTPNQSNCVNGTNRNQLKVSG